MRRALVAGRVLVVAGAVYLGLRWHSTAGCIQAAVIGGLAWGLISGVADELGHRHRSDGVVEALAAWVGFEVARAARRRRRERPPRDGDLG